ncbi:hypothetical protein BaRGS_00028070 [Batillaria attramentaria]|uniref:Uncharacterized protein n=1 Tax=Batillaria attramentaria TaxID=370345 RepID=A0ABD0K0W8_9CAEN
MQLALLVQGKETDGQSRTEEINFTQWRDADNRQHIKLIQFWFPHSLNWFHAKLLFLSLSLVQRTAEEAA